jgi:anthranilate synthase/aminodeoxychorismate synthase-like glutamine amidotransferase
MLLIIDNYDSFTYNLVQLIRALGVPTHVAKNDAITLNDIDALQPSHLLISPGPGRPNNAGITLDAIQTFAGKLPILGVCLGHQAIAQFFGADITHAQHVMHGKTSLIHHHHDGIFANTPTPFTATRYHSLIIDEATLPDTLTVTAWTERNNQRQEIMRIKHKELMLEGGHFHPASILTTQGETLLATFLGIA